MTRRDLWWKLTKQCPNRSYRYDLCWKWNWVVVIDQIRCGLWWKLDRTTTWPIVQIWYTLIMKVSCQDRSIWVRSVTKFRQKNDVTDCTSVVYAKNKIELSWPIRPSVVCDENQTRQWHDRSCRCSLCQKQNQAVMTDQTRCGLWWKPNRTTTWSIL